MIKNEKKAIERTVDLNSKKIVGVNGKKGFLQPGILGVRAVPGRRKVVLTDDMFSEASTAILPVSPAIINFLYSLDGRAMGAKSYKNFDEQWNRSFFAEDSNFLKFFKEVVIEEKA